MSEIVEVISMVGFPIVCSGALFWYVVNTQDRMRATIEENTKVMQKMYAVLDDLTPKPIVEEDK